VVEASIADLTCNSIKAGGDEVVAAIWQAGASAFVFHVDFVDAPVTLALFEAVDAQVIERTGSNRWIFGSIAGTTG
jgi:hypothetical protein